MWPIPDTYTVGLFECLSLLRLICAQSGRVLGLERKTDPASSAMSSRKGLKDNNNRLLGIVNKFCIPFGTESKISIFGGLDSDCIEMTLQRVANFRVTDPEGYNIKSISFYTDCVNSPISFFKETDHKEIKILRYRYFLKWKKALN